MSRAGETWVMAVGKEGEAEISNREWKRSCRQTGRRRAQVKPDEPPRQGESTQEPGSSHKGSRQRLAMTHRGSQRDGGLRHGLAQLRWVRLLFFAGPESLCQLTAYRNAMPNKVGGAEAVRATSKLATELTQADTFVSLVRGVNPVNSLTHEF